MFPAREEKWLRLKDLALAVDEPVSTLRDWCAREIMVHSKIGRTIRARIQDYNHAVEKGIRGGDDRTATVRIVAGLDQRKRKADKGAGMSDGSRSTGSPAPKAEKPKGRRIKPIIYELGAGLGTPKETQPNHSGGL